MRDPTHPATQAETLDSGLDRLRALIDAGEAAYANGRFVAVTDPTNVAREFIQAGRRRAETPSPALASPQSCGRWMVARVVAKLRQASLSL